MNKNIVIGILCVLVVGLGSYLTYISMQNNEKESGRDDMQEEVIEGNNNAEEIKREYIHFTSTELKMDKKSSLGIGITIEVKDGKLIETSNNGLKISGIDGNVKYFTYDIADGGPIGLLVLTEDGKVYAATLDAINSSVIMDKNVIFEQVNINDKVIDITEYVYPHPFVTSDGIYLGVVLENGKIYAIDYNRNYSLDTKDYGIYKSLCMGMIVYSNNEVVLGDEENKKIQYNNQNIIAKKILYKEDYNKGFIYYIQDRNDRLYKIETEFETDARYDSKIKTVSLVKEAVVRSIEKQDNNHVKVLYEDNTTDVLEVSLEQGICTIN